MQVIFNVWVLRYALVRRSDKLKSMYISDISRANLHVLHTFISVGRKFSFPHMPPENPSNMVTRSDVTRNPTSQGPSPDDDSKLSDPEFVLANEVKEWLEDIGNLIS
jgi:hypothetical protein